MNDLDTKLEALRGWFGERGSVLVAFSGGIDSSLLLKVATDVLGPEKALGVTSLSESLSKEAYEGACALAQEMGFNQETIEYSELAIENYAENPINRCYFCKSELFGRLREIAEARGLEAVVEGSNFDDVGDHRPGMKAAGDLGICSPLKELEVTKDQIRAMAKTLGLPNWDMPSQACMSSRFPYGMTITKDGLDQVAEGEKFLRDLGFTQVRVRHLGSTAKIELLPEEMGRLFSVGVREEVIQHLKGIGFTYVTVDLQGYRTGAMNEAMNRQG
jgi:uncharacterized protein